MGCSENIPAHACGITAGDNAAATIRQRRAKKIQPGPQLHTERLLMLQFASTPPTLYYVCVQPYFFTILGLACALSLRFPRLGKGAHPERHWRPPDTSDWPKDFLPCPGHSASRTRALLLSGQYFPMESSNSQAH